MTSIWGQGGRDVLVTLVKKPKVQDRRECAHQILKCPPFPAQMQGGCSRMKVHPGTRRAPPKKLTRIRKNT
jgi:hypothetical protein